MSVLNYDEAKNKEKADALITLIKKHPTLPVVPMVSYEVVGDDSCSTWMGTWGNARVDKYLIVNGRVYFYDEEDMEPVLVARFGDDNFSEMTENGCLQSSRAMPWITAIVVSID